MKLIIVSVLLLLGGIPNITSGENVAAGISCTVIGIVLITIKLCLSKQVTAKKRERVEQAESFIKAHDEYDAFAARWRPMLDKHYQLSQEAEKAYAAAINAGDINGPTMQRAIELCQQDLCLEEQLRQYEIEKIKRDMETGYTTPSTKPRALASYPSFKRLAIIYEKQKRYDDAIAVCRCAIEAGRIDDGTKGRMDGRMLKLQNKKAKEVEKGVSTVDVTDLFD